MALLLSFFVSVIERGDIVKLGRQLTKRLLSRVIITRWPDKDSISPKSAELLKFTSVKLEINSYLNPSTGTNSCYSDLSQIFDFQGHLCFL